MSWEIVSKTERPCPCRNGTYSIIRESDDWNRYEESWVMNCQQCMENYTLETTHFVDRDGLNDQARNWKPKSS